MPNRERRARIKLVQEAHLDKHGQRVIDAIHRDIGASYACIYATYHAYKVLAHAVHTLVQGIQRMVDYVKSAWGKDAANYFRADSMTVTADGVDIKATAFASEKNPGGLHVECAVQRR